MIAEIIQNKINNNEKIIIELGCGPYKTKGAIGIDILEMDGVDIVADLEKGLPFIPDKSVDELSSRHLLEHLDNFELVIKEIHRIIKPDGIHKVTVPHFSNPHYYSDYTHKRFFGLYSFDYFATEETKLKRKVPSFYSDLRFDILKRKLNFKSQFAIRHFIKRPAKALFNSSGYFQELYEEIFCYLVPCQEIYFEMTPIHK